MACSDMGRLEPKGLGRAITTSSWEWSSCTDTDSEGCILFPIADTSPAHNMLRGLAHYTAWYRAPQPTSTKGSSGNAWHNSCERFANACPPPGWGGGGGG
jgi:hypothetical protein